MTLVLRAKMAAFDRLPPAVRRRLDEGPFNYDARALASLSRRHRLGEPELLAVVDALDDHARAVLASAVRVAGANRLDAPDPDEAMLLAAARRAPIDGVLLATAANRCESVLDG